MTSTTLPMLETYPQSINLDRRKLAATIAALIVCSEACTGCADACLSEGMVAELTKCIRTTWTAPTSAPPQPESCPGTPATTRTSAVPCSTPCVMACKSCGDECARHADAHEHCRICAEACRTCEQACRDLLASMS